jgi:hypothetical protein
MKERTSAFSKTTLHHGGKLGHASFPYNTSTNALSKTTLHHKGNPTHASFPSTMKESTRESPFPTTTLHCEGN